MRAEDIKCKNWAFMLPDLLSWEEFERYEVPSYKEAKYITNVCVINTSDYYARVSVVRDKDEKYHYGYEIAGRSWQAVGPIDWAKSYADKRQGAIESLTKTMNYFKNVLTPSAKKAMMALREPKQLELFTNLN